MELKYSLLGFLQYASMSGYDLVKVFNASVGFFWKASQSQIYSALDKLEKEKLITYELVVQDGKPNKKIYSITETGKSEWLNWLQSDTRHVNQKNALLLRVFFMAGLPKEQAEAFFERLIESNEKELRSMQEVPESIVFYEKDTSKTDALFWSFTYDYGREYLKMCSSWARSCLEKIQDAYSGN